MWARGIERPDFNKKTTFETVTTLITSSEVFPYIFLAKLESNEIVKILSLADCVSIKQLDILRLIIMIKLLRPRVTHHYPLK